MCAVCASNCDGSVGAQVRGDMSSTLTEKLIARAASREAVVPGETVWVDVDLLLTHDVFGPDIFRLFELEFGENAQVFDPEKIVIFPDHYVFTDDPRAQRNLKILDAYAKKHKIVHYYPPHSSRYRGVCHIAVAQEGLTRPGAMIFGSDSHTCMAGAFGLFATGIGNTDAAFAVATGRQWLKVPKSLKFNLHGTLAPGVMAKDVILNIIGRIGVAGASYKAIEFDGDGLSKLSVEERMTLCNMVVEAGAKNGVAPADDVIVEYVRARGGEPIALLRADKNAVYEQKFAIDLSAVEPSIAKPHSPDNLAMVRNVSDVVLDRCYMGSCTGGKISDFMAAASLLKGREVRVETFIVPATVQVSKALETTYIGTESLKEIFEGAGCQIIEPSCAACLGGHLDTPGRARDGETILSSTNRNFPGRMGSLKAEVFLASSLTVAASALTGQIADPRDHLQGDMF